MKIYQDFSNCKVVRVTLESAKPIIVSRHYMKTWPSGAMYAYALMNNGNVVGIMVSGVSSSTRKKISNVIHNIGDDEYVELMRTWISDTMGNNSESWMMSRVIDHHKDMGYRVFVTNSGGCKDDVGFIFQASGWLYFGAKPCNDFFLTSKNEYKNISAAMRYGRVPKNIIKEGADAVGRHLFGEGEIISARRHLYIYPIESGIRRRLKKIAMDFPKNPKVFRKDQLWYNSDMADCARGALDENRVLVKQMSAAK